MSNPQRYRLHVPLSSLSLVLALCGTVPVHAADKYLDSIEAEASDLTVDSAVTLGETGTTEQDSNALPNDLDRSGFEELLRSRFIGSFMFYNKLDDGDKTAVFQEYTQSKDIERVRKKIIGLFSAN